MGKVRFKLPPGLSLKIYLAMFVLLLSSCAMPKVVILEDKLTAEEHNDLGYVYENKGMDDLAEKEYLLALKKHEYWAVPLFNVGNLYFKKADYAKSELYFRKALD